MSNIVGAITATTLCLLMGAMLSIGLDYQLKTEQSQTYAGANK